jgi:hypothetical protein
LLDQAPAQGSIDKSLLGALGCFAQPVVANPLSAREPANTFVTKMRTPPPGGNLTPSVI